MSCLQILRFLLAITAVLFSFQAAAIELVPGDIITGDSALRVFLHVDPITGEQTPFPSIEEPQLGFTRAMEIDADGNLFFIDNHLKLTRWDLKTGARSSFSNIVGSALGLDQSGNALVMRAGMAVTRIDSFTGSETVIFSLENVVEQVGDIAVGIDGEIYLSAMTFLTPRRPFLFGINPLNGNRRVITDLPYHDITLFVEASGDILLTGWGNELWRIDPATGAVKDFLGPPGGDNVSIDSSGTIFVSSGSGIVRVDPITGQWAVVSTGFLLVGSEIAVIPGPLPECRDGIDNDGDGLIDFPEEPGCEDSRDPTEFADSPFDFCLADLISCEDDLLITESDLGICEDANAQLATDLFVSQVRVAELEIALDQCLNPPTQCSDGIDNDGDGKIDLEDRQCLNAEQDSEKSKKR